MAKKKAPKKTVKKAKKTTKSAAKKAAPKRAQKAVGPKKVKAVKKAAKKKTARKTTSPKRPKRAAAKSVKTTQRAAKAPKRPRRTRQALPPAVPPAALEVDLTPTPSPPPPAPAPEPPAGPQPGDSAPDFALPDSTGAVHRLSDYRGKRVVLYFYPKDDTPGCTVEACGFRDHLAAFTDRNAVVFGISPDSPNSHERFSQKFSLTFPLLADEGHGVAEQYGVWVLKKQYGREYMGITRTTFIIDAEGRVQDIFRQVKPEGHEQEVLERLG